MRLTHIPDGQLRALAEADFAFSPRLLGHLSVCEPCQNRLAEFTEAHSVALSMSSELADPQLADRVIGEISKREERNMFVRYTTIGFGATLLTVGAVNLTDMTVYLGAFESVWQLLVSLGQNLVLWGGSTIDAVSRIMSGEQAVLVTAAVATLLWVGLLDKIAGRLKAARH